MPVKDERAKALAYNGKHRTAGRINVIYVDVNGKQKAATVVGAGTTSGLKLRIGSRMGTGQSEIVDNVAAATTLAGTNVYHSR